MTGLHLQDGRVSRGGGDPRRPAALIRASRGVVLAAGGFERNAVMRQHYQRPPIGTEWTTGVGRQHRRCDRRGRGGGGRARPDGRRLVGPVHPAAGRPLLLPGRAQPARLPAGQRRRPALRERVRAVRRRGARHVRGAHRRHPAYPVLADLRPAVPEQLRVRGPATGPVTAPALVGGGLGAPRRHGRRTGHQRRPGPPRAGRDRDQVQRLRPNGQGRGLPPRRLGVRPVLRRPAAASQPEPRATGTPPFYAVKIVPGDLGTKGGLRTDERARVLRADGTPIPGCTRRATPAPP